MTPLVAQGSTAQSHPQGREARRPPGPADDQIEFVINAQTARLLGVDVPNALQLLADEIIE